MIIIKNSQFIEEILTLQLWNIIDHRLMDMSSVFLGDIL
jgi:hypothetical protein